jgi:hypothetical protein
LSTGNNWHLLGAANVTMPARCERGYFFLQRAAAVNTSGNATVIYSGYNAADVHTEYASNYTP